MFLDNQKCRLVRTFRSKKNSKNINSILLDKICNNESYSLNDYSQLSINEIESEYIKMQKISAEYLTIADQNYPNLLKMLYDPPSILYCKGHTSLLTKPLISIIGGRDTSYNYLNLVKELARFLAKSGMIIVSGLANGVDTYAHEGAGASNTIGVIASGLDICYPKQNYYLSEAIKEEGLLISENPLGIPPMAKLFPKRNRIIVGLSKMVVGASIKQNSGSMITCRVVIENNREIIVIPGFPDDICHQGSNKLIKDGANIFTNFDDLYEYILTIYNIDDKKIKSKKEFSVLNNHQLKFVIKKIPHDGIEKEDLALKLNIDISRLMIYIAQLELENIIFIDQQQKIFLANKFL